MRRFALGTLALLAVCAAFAACGFDSDATGDETITPAEAGVPEASLIDSAKADAEPDRADTSITDAPVDVPVDAPDVFVPPPTAGQALQFTGGSYVAIGALAIPTDFTLEAWIHRDASAVESYVMAKDRSGQGPGQCRFGIDETGHLFFIMADNTGDDHGLFSNGGYTLSSPAALAVDAWHHVAVTKSGANFALFVDGVSVDMFSAAAAFAYGGPAVSFRIGARVANDGTGVSGEFEGIIDEVRVWNVARTGAQITASMKTPIVAGNPAFASVVGSWRFNEGVGTMTADAKGLLPGTLVASPTWLLSTAY